MTIHTLDPNKLTTALKADLVKDSKGKILNRLDNTALILERHPAWEGVFRYDEFNEQILKSKAPPIHRGEKGQLDDNDVTDARRWVFRNVYFEPGKEMTNDAIQNVARRNPFHPVRDYLEALEWDGKERVGSWLHDYLGAANTEYTAEIGRCWIKGAVGRILSPGCKMDYMLILEGPQGARKSTVCAILGGDHFSELVGKPGDTDSLIALRGQWIIEMAELDGMRKAEITAVKQFISVQKDRYRDKYARQALNRPRQCVFIGTVNDGQYLKDMSGGRRFLPTEIGTINTDALAEDRDQLFAEAVVMFRKDPKIIPNIAEDILKSEQDKRREQHPWEDAISTFLAIYGSQRTAPDDHVTMSEIFETVIDKPMDRRNQADVKSVSAILNMFGWDKKRKRVDGILKWVYARNVEQ